MAFDSKSLDFSRVCTLGKPVSVDKKGWIKLSELMKSQAIQLPLHQFHIYLATA